MQCSAAKTSSVHTGRPSAGRIRHAAAHRREVCAATTHHAAPASSLFLTAFPYCLRYSFAELRAAGCSAAQLRAAGCTAASLRAVAFPLPALVAAGYSACDLLQAAFTPQQLHSQQISLDDIAAALPLAYCAPHSGFCYRCACASSALLLQHKTRVAWQDARRRVAASELGHRRRGPRVRRLCSHAARYMDGAAARV